MKNSKTKDEYMNEATEKEKMDLPTPEQIKKYLDEYVIGQEEAKKVLSVAVYNHYKKIIHNQQNKQVEIEKSNIILAGETGCGKTLLVKTIAKLLNVPCYIQDCTKLTASGYVGEDVENCLVGLLQSCHYNVAAAELGIVMLDEGDKLAKAEAGPSITRDVSGECVQQSLLKIVEGEKIGVPPMGGRKHPEQSLIYVDTTNILFIFSGAFVGLEDIIENRLKGNHKIGFAAIEENGKEKIEDPLIHYATAQDVKDFGFIPEFVGRFPIITCVDKLDVSSLKKIIKEPKNAILKQYIELLRMDGIELKFTDAAITEIAKLAYELETGARGLRTIMEVIMTDIMFEAPGLAEKGKKNITITDKIVVEKTKKKFSCLKSA